MWARVEEAASLAVIRLEVRKGLPVLALKSVAQRAARGGANAKAMGGGVERGDHADQRGQGCTFIKVA